MGSAAGGRAVAAHGRRPPPTIIRDDPEALPLVGPGFCEEISGLLASPEYADLVAFRTWLQGLQAANC